MPKIILTYGTFDLFHVGHLNLLRRARELGDRLIVGISTDEFNSGKGKETIIRYAHRAEIVRSIRYVDDTIPESSWEQKRSDILRFNAGALVMGNDWTGKFDSLKDICDVLYLPRTVGVSSSSLKAILNSTGDSHIVEMRKALEVISTAIEPFQ